MTARELATLLHARKIGKGKWQARCPAHPDRKPSLAIGEGRKGVLLKCMSNGCDTRLILEVLGLKFSDLFEGKPLDHKLMRQIKDAEEKHDRSERLRRFMKNRALDQRDYWHRASQHLGRRMASGEDLKVRFHQALAYMRRCERIADAYDFPCARQMT